MAKTTVENLSSRNRRANPLFRFVSTYVFSKDHKTIGLQFLFSSLVWFFVGGLLALAIRWQLAWPWSDMPIFGPLLFADSGGQITPEFYNTLFTMHGTIMVFFVTIPILVGAFGNYLVPLMIGAKGMAFPTLNMISYWCMWPAFGCVVASFFIHGNGASAGWTSYPPLSVIQGDAQSMWIVAMLFVSGSTLASAINFVTTIIQMRAPGMFLFRLPMTVWGILVSAIVQLFAFPVLIAALLMQFTDRELGTGFFLPETPSIENGNASGGGGSVLLWQYLFWFAVHPAVSTMILPVVGMVSDMVSCFSRKRLFGYRSTVYAIIAIAVLVFFSWGQQRSASLMSQTTVVSVMVSTMLIAVPNCVVVCNWIATLWGGRLHLTTAMLFSVGFILMFITGGLSGIVMSAPPIRNVVHNTHYVVAHFHLVLSGSILLGGMGAIYFWFPKMFGRRMHEPTGKIHFLLSFIFINGTFFPMQLLSRMPRRVADPYLHHGINELLPLNQFMTICAIGMGLVQLLFLVNFLGSMFFGPKADSNPWNSNTLEWDVASPPKPGNFEIQPVIYRGPYEYRPCEFGADFFPQSRTQPDESREIGAGTM